MTDPELRKRLHQVLKEEVGEERAQVVFHTIEVTWNWLGCPKLATSRTDGWKACVVAAIAAGIIDAERLIQGKDSVPLQGTIELRLLPGGRVV